MWIKLDKTFFFLKNDIFLCNCYIRPDTSELHKQPDMDYFETLREEIAVYSTLGEIIFMGDFNSRTSDLKELYELPEEDEFLEGNVYISNEVEQEDFGIIIGKCSNEDIIVNTFGRHLITLVEQSLLCIVNGSITYVGPHGVSSIDYCICSVSLFNDILRFNVQDQTWYSDHNPISMSLRLRLKLDLKNISTDSMNMSSTFNFLWNEQYKEQFIQHMEAEVTQDKCI